MSYILRPFDPDSHLELATLWCARVGAAVRARVLEEVARRPAERVRGPVDTSTARGWWQSARNTLEVHARIPSFTFDSDPGWTDLESMVVGALCIPGMRPLVSLEVRSGGEWYDIEHAQFSVQQRYDFHRRVHECDLGSVDEGLWRFHARAQNLPLGDAHAGLVAKDRGFQRALAAARPLRPCLGIRMWRLEGQVRETLLRAADRVVRKGLACSATGDAVLRSLQPDCEWALCEHLNAVPAV